MPLDNLQRIFALLFFWTAAPLSADEAIICVGQSHKFKGVVNVATFQIEPTQNNPSWAKDGKHEAYVLVTTGLQTFQGIDSALGE